MRKSVLPGILFSLLAACVAVRAQTPLESSMEARFQLDVHVSEAALATYLPEGWTSMVATQGNAKDANLRVIFIDRMTINAPDGKPLGKGSNRLVYLVAPVKDPSGAAVQLVLGGLTEDAADAPGPFGNYQLATTHVMKREVSHGAGPTMESQDWNFAAASGDHLEVHLKYEGHAANRGNPAEVKYYSAKDPHVYQISKQEQVLDVMRNATTNPPDRVSAFTFKASGPVFSKLFDGTQKYLSWDNVIWLTRTVSTP